ncbi:MAG: hypothetical protein M1308_14940 [Actinobacteria bacterium]|nr:hypothetical protein [Actinomycetota bacterium]
MKIKNFFSFKFLIVFLSLLVSFIFLLSQVSCSWSLRKADGTTEAFSGETEENGTTADTTAAVPEPERVLKTPNAYIISQLKVPGQAIDVKVSGNYAYLTNDLGILYIIDVSDKSNPKIVGKLAGIDSANIVIIQDDYAYVSYTSWIAPEDNKSQEVTSICGFKIIDIKDKNNPEVVGDYISGEKSQKSVQGMFIKGNYAFLNSTVLLENTEESQLEIIDINDKSNPKLAGSCKIEGAPNGIFVQDNYAYINNSYFDYQTKQYTQESKLFIVDIGNIKNPEVVGSSNIPANSWSIFVKGSFAYITSSIMDEETKNYSNSAMQVIDITNKNAPLLKGKCNIPGGAWEIDSKDNFLVVSNNEGGVNIIDINDSNNPKIVNSLNTGGNSYDITISGNYGYIADGFEGLVIIGLQKEKPGEENLQAGDGSSKTNTAPHAVIEVFGDKINTIDFIEDNPVYFSARDSFDPDGDDISYKWYVNGTEVLNNYPQNSIISESDKELAYLFQKSGDYEISLTVSDGNLTNQAEKQIKVENQPDVIKQIKEHNFDIEIECSLENKGPVNLKDIESYLRTPQTYDPFQVINSIKTSIPGVEEVFDDSWNLLSHFKFGKGTVVKKGGILKAIITANVTMYEYSFPSINSAGKNYELGDEDLSIYTTDDLFINSDNLVIIEAAKKTVGNETDPVKKAKKLYKYVAAKLSYDFARAKVNYDFMYASEILKIGRGVCADYAILYAALLRASGIPARVVGGVPSFSILGEKDQELDVGHAWTEVKLPGYGWIPIDITQEKGFMSTDYFLNLATEKSSSFLYESQTMDWTSYYFDGFKYKWDGTEQPEVEQSLIYRVKNLTLSDMQVYGG